MSFLRNLLETTEKKWFAKGAKFERFYPLFEAADTLFYTSGKVTKNAAFVRDGADLKRVMITVVIALCPAILVALYNTGLQANLAIAGGAGVPDGWRTALVTALGMDFSPENVIGCAVHGLVYYLPVFIVTFVVGLGWEVLFCIVRKEEVNEGFFVTGFLFPLIVPATIPLWQVALAISFGVVLGKEVFGGTGYNILNPALTARAFLFFSYPIQISGNKVWVAADGYTRATPLANGFEGGVAAIEKGGDLWWDAFYGFIPGCMGETSALACLIGAFILIVTGVGSWRIMLSVTLGTAATAFLFNSIGSDTNPMMSMPFTWHMVLGGWALGTVFMATDPVTAAQTNIGRYIYGFLIGFLVVMVRCVNPAYPEGMMMCILLMNVFAPLIDYYVVQAHIKRRKARYA
ncbi:MAG: NADH:ubiquinone reductase (Na(+)-transporting) subunit B [Proteobacteria bacterium]|nr:NADH:ubiquinone reductase (Na(+)-transporting) subunit B [Pseudomonadota bacterium]